MSAYIHKTDRRLRVRSDYILRNPQQVEQLIDQLKQIEAIDTISHKRFAGSVAITFNSSEMSADDLLETVESHGWLRSEQRHAFVENAVKNGSKTLVKGIAALALRQLVGPTLAKALPI
ncbi:HMA2 domain-containing protein [Ferrimonas senticii]|uniref:HMA2 domain-containing protein n=1 Tax=Ferrimonas senticii TaxID=394566 RepID=UPI00040063F8|nr:hypothetical protein [Ferrimonas senticii]